MSGRRLVVAVLLGVALAPGAAQPPPAPAARPASPAAPFQLTAPVQQSLLRLQEQWLRWIGAFYQHKERTAEALVPGLLTTARRLGMARLPDLSLAALAPAVEAAREGDFERAQWALAAAEQLDPGRAETAFAAARVAAGERSYLSASGHYLSAYARLFRQPWLRSVWLHHLVLWSWTALVATGALALALLMATRGRRLVAGLAAVLERRRLPRAAALALVLVALAAPAALPYGGAWLVLAWTVLLWAYLSPSQRVVLAGLLLLVGAAPFLAAEQERRVSVAVSPPARAIESVARGQLYGDLFVDLETLQATLPESAAVLHLLADFHRRLGQWDAARSLYGQVLEREPQNTAALIDLGVYYFTRGDFALAIQHFQQAAAAGPRSAAALFNLSQAYSESYLFDEQRRALEQARAIDSERVKSWIAATQQRVVAADGGLARIPEIRRELLAAHAPAAAAARPGGGLGRGLGLLAAVAAVLAAAALRRAGGGGEDAEAALPPERPSGLDPWLRAFLPGLAAAKAGDGGRAFLALLLPVALLLLPLGTRIGYRVPWGYDPGDLVPRILAVAGIVVYLGARLTWELKRRV